MSQSGYTLIEVLITVAILAVVTATAIPTLQNYASGLEAEADNEQVRNALSKARFFARANNIAVDVQDQNDQIILMAGTATVSVYPLQQKTVNFYDASNNQISVLSVNNSGAFPTNNTIQLSGNGSTETLTLLRSGRLQ
ncbi:MAG: prepilin-type N-terminal cleavage/methylation domain-containing protein [Pseudomonadota bacterium]|nr:prepilin-type N-terminal cleavage/methylation domain-containing protein [Pseudomonadota bacterium]